jgi:Cu-processing system permease protein
MKTGLLTIEAAVPQTKSKDATKRGDGISRRTMLGALAGKEFGDRFRSGWVVACVALWIGAISLTSFMGLLQIGRIGPLGYERTVISMLNLAQYLVPLLGLLLGHDLIVGENEERTLRLLLASGVSRSQLLLGKFIGGCLTMAVPLVAGFLIAGTVIGIATKDAGVAPFLKLAISGLVLGVVFVGVGLTISCFSRSRVQAIVLALLAWCAFVFVLDLVALGIIVSTKSPAAIREIEIVCDTMHVNAAADIHSEADSGAASKVQETGNQAGLGPASAAWLAINPVDLFRVVNLSATLGVRVPGAIALASFFGWIFVSLLAARWKLGRSDL